MNKVRLTERVKGDSGWRYFAVTVLKNGRVKSTEGTFYLEWRDGGKRCRLAVGDNPAEAVTAMLRKEAELAARKHGLISSPEIPGKRLLKSAISDYLDDVLNTKKRTTWAAYRVSLEYFEAFCPKANLEDVNRDDMQGFAAYLRNKGMTGRTAWNKFNHTMGFFKEQGVKLGVKKNDWPDFVEEIPEIYEQEELDALFAACNGEEKIWWTFFLMTGMREQEVMHVYWRDVDLVHGTVRVSHKPDLGWTPKAYKEREIPIPDKLVALLKTLRRSPKCQLVFFTNRCTVRDDFLRRLKELTKDAGLNQDNFWLHKFRATFATRALWAGVDLATVQAWMGHSDLKSTMRYLRPQRGAQVRAKVNEIFA